ncbi:MAG TPA: hypothetical protein VFV50_05300 [Bdellovibrionales bacterium]|nr:hypothetical protein [Bdellovibrionales bacterium]
MKTVLAILTVTLLTAAGFADAPLEGVYKLTGHSLDEGAKPYRGKVVIKKTNDVYHLIWLIGRGQAQTGVALLDGDILSVTYVDLSGRDLGVSSFKVVSSKKLEGRWIPLGAKGRPGIERLEYLGPAQELPAERPAHMAKAQIDI